MSLSGSGSRASSTTTRYQCYNAVMNDTNNNYHDVLLEQIRDQNKAVLEAVSGIRAELAQVPKREEFDELRQDVKIIKAAVTDLSQQVADHERRLSRLEAA